MKRFISLLNIVLALSLLVTGCVPKSTPAPTPKPVPTPTATPKPTEAPPSLGTAENPIVLFMVPYGDTPEIQASTEWITHMLSEKTGYVIKGNMVTSYAEVIEAMSTGRAHVGTLAAFEYLQAHEEFGVECALAGVSFGSPYYKGQVIARADSGIQTLADLKGKSMCWVDAASTSGYIIPRAMLKAAGVDPDTDLAQQVEAGSHDYVALAVYEGDCDAGACYIDARDRIEDDFPDVKDKTIVIAESPEIPNDGLHFVRDFPADMRTEIVEAMKEIMATGEGKEAVEVSCGWSEVEERDDSFYDGFRAMLSASEEGEVIVTTSSGAPGTIVKVSRTGLDTPNLLYMGRFATPDWAVQVPLHWDEPGSLSLAVPLLPPGPVSLTLMTDGWQIGTVEFTVLDLVDTGEPAGEVVFEFLSDLADLLDVMYAMDMSELPEAADLLDAILLTKSDVAWLTATLEDLRAEEEEEILGVFDAVLVASGLHEEMEALLAEAQLVNLEAEHGVKVASLNLVPWSLPLASWKRTLIIAGVVLGVAGIVFVGVGAAAGFLGWWGTAVVLGKTVAVASIVKTVGTTLIGMSAICSGMGQLMKEPKPHPKITGISPSKGNAGTSIRIEGKGFRKGMVQGEVLFRFKDKDDKWVTVTPKLLGGCSGPTFITLEVPDVSAKVAKNKVQADVWVELGKKKSNKWTFTITDINANKRLKISSGDNQPGTVNTWLVNPLKVKAIEKRDDGTTPVLSGETIEFFKSGPGELSHAKATTGADGIASTRLKLGTTAGTYLVQAKADGFANSVTFKVEAKADKPSEMVIVEGQGQKGEVERRLGQPFVVLIKDKYANPVSGQTVSFKVRAGEGQMDSRVVTSNSQGRAWSTLRLGPELGAENKVEISVKTDTREITKTVVVTSTGPSVTIGDCISPDGQASPSNATTVEGSANGPIPIVRIELKNHTGQTQKVKVSVEAVTEDGKSKLGPVPPDEVDVPGGVGNIKVWSLNGLLGKLFGATFPQRDWEVIITVKSETGERKGTIVFEIMR